MGEDGDDAAALERLIARLEATDDAAERLALLLEQTAPADAWRTAERLKLEADRLRYLDRERALRWTGDMVALGQRLAAPPAVALGWMVEALIAHDRGLYRESLAAFDRASALFEAANHSEGWARTQIGRTLPCIGLGRFDEALERAQRARAILERLERPALLAAIDNNLSLLLDSLNRPAEALRYCERALATYRAAGPPYHAAHALGNRALLLWRLGQVRESLATHEEARGAYLALGAAADVAREDSNIGLAHLSLGHLAEAASRLAAARERLLDEHLPHLAMRAGRHLVECWNRMGRYSAAIDLARAIAGEAEAMHALVDQAQALLCQAQAHASLHAYEAALTVLDDVSAVLAANGELAQLCAPIDLGRAQLLIAIGEREVAQPILEAAIQALQRGGLSVEAAHARVLRGDLLLDDARPAEARALAAEALATADGAGLDWLAAQALHLRGRVALRERDLGPARRDLAAAAARADRVQRRVAWDDRASFAGTTTGIYADAMRLALDERRLAPALRYAERLKAQALADHLRAGIDVRPRARDERSRALVAELDRLRERYGWLAAAGAAATVEAPAVRWSDSRPGDAERRREAARIEQRIAEIWRELQTANPAYRGEAAALALDGEPHEGDEDAAAERWLAALRGTLAAEGEAALLEYAALGEDLVLFVVRQGAIRSVLLPGAEAETRRLVQLLRLNVERCAAIASDVSARSAMRALGRNARAILARLHDALLRPAAALIEGAQRLVMVPHGEAHHVPFHALHDGAGYLIERVEVSYAPAAGLLEHFEARQRRLTAGHGAGLGALVIACSCGGSLPHALEEGRAVAAALGGTLLVEQEGTLARIRALAGRHAVLHLATHGVFRPDEPLFSSLQVADGLLTTLEVFDLELRCSLVTLSACETALGRTGAGDELMGLSRAFLYAGAPSLGLSLWKVEDSSTARLMEGFYAALRGGAGKAAALRRAQLAVLRDEADGQIDHSAPFFWAPFELIGHAGAPGIAGSSG